jgi:hypothetical protein
VEIEKTAISGHFLQTTNLANTSTGKPKIRAVTIPQIPNQE